MGLGYRLSFGLGLLFVGLSHYMGLEEFVGFVSSGLGPLTPLGALWGYILPGLMVVGGGLFALGIYPEVAVWTAGLALGSIPPGLLLKPLLGDVALSDVMPGVINAFIWMFVYGVVVKCMCCSMEEQQGGKGRK